MVYRQSTREILQDIYDRYELGVIQEEIGDREWTYTDGMDNLRFFMRSLTNFLKKTDEYVLAKYQPNEAQFIRSKYSEIFKDLGRMFEEDPQREFDYKLAEELADLIVLEYLEQIHGSKKDKKEKL